MSQSEKHIESIEEFIEVTNDLFPKGEATTFLDILKVLFKNKLGFEFIGLRRFIFIMFGLIALNANLSIVALGKYVFWENTNVRVLVIVLIVAILAVAFGAYKAYHYAMADLVKELYDKLIAKRMKVIINKVIDKISQPKDSSAEKKAPEDMDIVEFHASFIELIEESFNQFPKIINKIFRLLFRSIPLMDTIMNIKEQSKTDKDKTSERLFKVLDDGFQENFSQFLSLKWLFWFIPLNIILILIFIGMM